MDDAAMSFQPADSLKNRTFVGLIIAQFLAGFNDQAIHAAAMFYAIHRGLFTEAQAISLMPLLFYAPWAIFVTASAYLADRYSKTTSIVVWKFSEIFISILVTLGFVLGTVYNMDAGVWIVLSAVFMMGTHAAFFSPAKYGAMPEILQPHALSKGNGVLESSTFLANILGTVCGGLLSFTLHDREWGIGLILLALSIVGAGASLMMAKLPPSDPTKKFDPITPLTNGLKTVFDSRPLALAVMGIAFFVFMVSYMRSTMYMHGQTRVPPWDDFHTSLIVAAVALGVGLGSPLAGWLSGGKIELGLVPVGCAGMIAACGFAAFLLDHEYALVGALIGIGFFSGFYMVPLYSLLQHRAPKKSKGEIVAVSNFFNVTGAMSASMLFFLLVLAGRATGLTPVVEQTDNVIEGRVLKIEKDPFHHVDGLNIGDLRAADPKGIPLKAENTISLLELPKDLTLGEKVIVSEFDRGNLKHFIVRKVGEAPRAVRGWFGREFVQKELYRGSVAKIDLDAGKIDNLIIDTDAGAKTLKAESRKSLLKLPGDGVEVGDEVIVSRYRIHDVTYFIVRDKGTPLKPAFNNEELPQYLFLGAGGMTLAILLLLYWKLPDFFVRTAFWWKSLGKRKIKAIGMDNLPTNGPVILASNCDRLELSLQMVSATDRHVVMILAESSEGRDAAPLLRFLAKPSSLIPVSPTGDWTSAQTQAVAALRRGDLLGVTVAGATHNDANVDIFLGDLLNQVTAPVIPVWCGNMTPTSVRVVFGEALAVSNAAHLRQEIEKLKVWIHANDGSAAAH
jgi:MFS family permease